MSVAIPSLRAAIAVPPWVKNELWRRARAVPSLDLRFADNKSLADAVTGASLVTFTRASSGTFVDSAGVLQTAATDVPRFDHNPTTGESLGLLVEESRTNLLLRSEEFNDAGWARTNIGSFGSGSTTDAAVSPAGTQTADLVAVANGVSAGAGFVRQTVLKAASAITYTYSAFAKADYYNRAILHVNDGAANSNRATVTVSLVNGSIEAAAAAAGTFSAASADVRAFPNGWYRIALTFTTSTETSLFCRLYPANSSADTSDGTRGIFLWGAQLEAASTPSSYIPTTTAAVTRSADVASISGSNFSSWYRQDEGTVFVNFLAAEGPSEPASHPFAISDNTINNRFTVFITGPSNANYRIVSSGTAFSPGSNSAGSRANIRASIAGKVGTDQGIGCVNNTLSTSSSPSSMPTVDRMYIGANHSGLELSAVRIRRITFWPTRLSNASLQTLTQ